MSMSVSELQQKQFGFLHEFHTERSANYLKELQAKLGDKIIDIAASMEIDRFTLYRWHLERTMQMIAILEKEFGRNVRDIILEYERTDIMEKGRNFAREIGHNSLEGIIPHFTGGNENRIVEKNENEVFIKTTGCFSGQIGFELEDKDLAYELHCGLDKFLVEGYNKELGCELIKVKMNGDDYCLHRIYKK